MASGNQYGFYGHQMTNYHNVGADEMWRPYGTGAAPVWRWPHLQQQQHHDRDERDGQYHNNTGGRQPHLVVGGGGFTQHHLARDGVVHYAPAGLPTNPRSRSRRANHAARHFLRGGQGWGGTRRSPLRYGPQPDEAATFGQRQTVRGNSRNNITLTDAVADDHHYHRDVADHRHSDRGLQAGRQRGDDHRRHHHHHLQQQQQQQQTIRDRDRRVAAAVPVNAPLLPTPQLLPAYAGSHLPQPRHHRHQTQWSQRNRPLNRPRTGAIHRHGRTDPAIQQPPIRDEWEENEAMEVQGWDGYGVRDLRERLYPNVGGPGPLGYGMPLDGLSDDDSASDYDYDSDDVDMFGDLDDLELLTMLLRHDCPPEHLAARLAAEAQRRRQIQRQRRRTMPVPSAPPLQQQTVATTADPVMPEDEPVKVPLSFEPADDKTHRERLTDELLKGTCECVICFENIEPTQGIWNCFKCFHIFHVCCVRKWALSQINPINVLLQDRTWRCPSCRDSKRIVPYNSYCFCGKTRNPDVRVCGMPHSCGDECGRRRRLKQPSCAHPCPVTCHPGPCPPCLVTVMRYCACTKTTLLVKCGDADAPSCTQTCDKPLACGEHRCKELCHRAACPPCDRLILQECYCGRDSRVLQCWETRVVPGSPYRCAAVCNRLLACRTCRCPRVCHEDRCGQAPCVRHSGEPEVATDSLLYNEPGQCTIL